MGCRTDGVPLLYAGKVHSLSGESEGGKTWLTLAWCAEQIWQGKDVVFVDFEDEAASVALRLRDLGLSDTEILKHFIYVSPVVAFAGEASALLTGLDCALVVFDGVTEYMNLHGLQPKDDVDVAEMLRLPRALAALGPAVVMLDHVIKDKQARGRYATGSQHKLSGITGAAYLLETDKPFAMDQEGSSRLFIAKDRPGAVRAHSVKVRADKHLIGEFVVPGGRIKDCELRPPSEKSLGPFRPTVVMENISRHLEDAGKPLTYNSFSGWAARPVGDCHSELDGHSEGDCHSGLD